MAIAARPMRPPLRMCGFCEMAKSEPSTCISVRWQSKILERDRLMNNQILMDEHTPSGHTRYVFRICYINIFSHSAICILLSAHLSYWLIIFVDFWCNLRKFFKPNVQLSGIFDGFFLHWYDIFWNPKYAILMIYIHQSIPLSNLITWSLQTNSNWVRM